MKWTKINCNIKKHWYLWGAPTTTYHPQLLKSLFPLGWLLPVLRRLPQVWEGFDGPDVLSTPSWEPRSMLQQDRVHPARFGSVDGRQSSALSSGYAGKPDSPVQSSSPGVYISIRARRRHVRGVSKKKPRARSSTLTRARHFGERDGRIRR